ncbi:MAG TPA: hypothetical protein VGF85_08995 [Opitutaceae bacterium]|jgi:hypothetical protein
MDSGLIAAMASVGKVLEQVTLPDGSRLLIMPYGGRILGLFPSGDDDNFFWVNRILRDAAAARVFFASSQWQNLGGDRTWIGPELDFFFPRYPDLSIYRPPSPLDGSDYEFSGDGTRLSVGFCVRSARARAPIDLKVTKAIGPAPNPLRHQGPQGGLGSLRYAGYTLTSTLTMGTDPPESVAVGIWNLIQLPHGGEMIVPTYGTHEPAVFFGDLPPGHLRIERGLARHRMAAPGEHKIGFQATEVTGRVGYLHRGPVEAQLVVRNFAVDPSGHYPDQPPKGAHATGYCVENCNVNNEVLGTFSELEYHAPALGPGESVREDVSQVWAYRGQPEPVALAAEKLLGLARESVWA